MMLIVSMCESLKVAGQLELDKPVLKVHGKELNSYSILSSFDSVFSSILCLAAHAEVLDSRLWSV